MHVTQSSAPARCHGISGSYHLILAVDVVLDISRFFVEEQCSLSSNLFAVSCKVSYQIKYDDGYPPGANREKDSGEFIQKRKHGSAG